MSAYRLTHGSDLVQRIEDGAFIPADPANADRMAFDAWVAAGNVPEPAEVPPEPVPASISDRQFYQQLAVEGVITTAEALAAVKTGSIPAVLEAMIAPLPEGERFAAEMLLSGAVTFERNHPLSLAIGAAQGRTPEQIDSFFRAAAGL